MIQTSLPSALTGNISSLNSEVVVNISPAQVVNVFTAGGDNQTPAGKGDCYIPLPEKKKYAGKGFMDLKTESGTPVKVTVTGYESVSSHKGIVILMVTASLNI